MLAGGDTGIPPHVHRGTWSAIGHIRRVSHSPPHPHRMSPTYTAGVSRCAIIRLPWSVPICSPNWSPPAKRAGVSGQGPQSGSEIGARAQRGIGISRNVPLTARGKGPLVSGAERPTAAAVASRTACRPKGRVRGEGAGCEVISGGGPHGAVSMAPQHTVSTTARRSLQRPVHAQASPYSCGRERRRPYGRGWVAGQSRAEPARAVALGNRRQSRRSTRRRSPRCGASRPVPRGTSEARDQAGVRGDRRAAGPVRTANLADW